MHARELSSHRYRNGLTLTLLGLLLLILGPTLLAFGWFGPGMVLLLAMPVLLILGIGKLTEPKVSLSLNHNSLSLHHRRGGWSLRWQDIQRIDQLAIGSGFERMELPYIGFRLKTPEILLDTINTRLAVGLLTEQRNVLILALRTQSPNPQAEDLFEASYYRSPTGKEYRGVLGMLGQRMKRFRELTGFDVIIAEELAGEEGMWLLKKYWAKAQYPQED
ncbi:MAG: DUF2982 domain-containing protein [Pseudomonadota bacterium]|uniref:DUF2982 domain-containing protein n=1 Tax=Gallaecimonas pentaromativorans TaxID=584787 RepID=UPI00067F1B2A|nr:DUF2982 domain-containing protein [Gallaecimonas pentaromativorans]MED5525094.1 DUF2982 domain-containing protein [Pseudomonadota bacterium]